MINKAVIKAGNNTGNCGSDLTSQPGSWPLTGGTRTTAKDTSGSENHLTLVNGPVWITSLPERQRPAVQRHEPVHPDGRASAERVGRLSPGPLPMGHENRTASVGFVLGAVGIRRDQSALLAMNWAPLA